MKNNRLTIGSEVIYNNESYVIDEVLSLEKVIIKPVTGTEKISKSIHEIQARNSFADTQEGIIPIDHDIQNLSGFQWCLAKKRQKILEPLCQLSQLSKTDIQEAADDLSITTRQVYNLLARYRASDYQLSALIPNAPKGGRGKKRLPTIVEQVISDCIEELYLTKQRLNVQTVYEEIKRRCHYKNLKAPSYYTIRDRIHKLQEKKTLTKREGFSAARQRTKPIIGKTPMPEGPHKIWQMDHTKVDIILVDEVYRQPIGRPYLTLAIDVFSRCIPGFYLSLESPSATSVGLCLTHAVIDKSSWLLERALDGSWPIWGKPEALYLDNAAEFHSEALSRGCAYHGINLDYRPIGRAHFGGVVERVIGTLMQLIHKLPGTTFSSVKDRGNYNSEAKAVMTLRELEYWLAIAINDYYHQKPHGTLLIPPIKRYEEAVLGKNGYGLPAKITNKKAFLIDFLPLYRRRLRREGIILDHIAYYAPGLSPMLADRKQYGLLQVRRDPRDLSYVYLLDPRSQAYIELTYRHLARPSISLWEHRKARQSLREKGIDCMDENRIFMAIEEMRDLAKSAAVNSHRARRDISRRQAVDKRKQTLSVDSFLDNAEELEIKPALPFEEIEIW